MQRSHMRMMVIRMGNSLNTWTLVMLSLLLEMVGRGREMFLMYWEQTVIVTIVLRQNRLVRLYMKCLTYSIAMPQFF